MIWYFMSIASYFWRRVSLILREQSRTIKYQPYENERETPDRQKTISFSGDETDALQKHHKKSNHRVAQRSMSFAAGVNGYGQSIAILTSGGDSQGMNAAVRATVRMALYAGARTYAVSWGYQGLVDGGEYIKEFGWDDVHGIMAKGGTVIGSARCKEFRTRDGRRRAAYNLVKREITNLVVIGGDGSLTGADIFRGEWKSLLEELKEKGELTQDEVERHHYLNLVGMVGSIDNDFCGTDMTIGADSALHRIVESADQIITTAVSHQRAFVLEVMGRNCGYLALIAGIAVGADWIFIPEWPSTEGWENELCDNLLKSRKKGRLLSIVILAEGAKDVHGNAIAANHVKELISTRLKYDTRVTVLGHVQRGGVPSAFDRVLGSRLGAEAALTVIESDETSEASVICLDGQAITRKPLHQCVDKCNGIKEAFKNNDMKKVLELRGRSFRSNLEIYKRLKHVHQPAGRPKGYRFAVLTIGAPAAGINAAVGAFARSAIYQGHTVLGVKDGFKGLVENQVQEMTWMQVEGWRRLGGSNLGVTRTLPKDHFDTIRDRILEHQIEGILLIGGFEAFHGLTQLTEARKKYDEFCIPMLLIPATMSNNVPGTWFSLGADTTLNVITECCDRLRQSAGSTADRVFIVETMGGSCGYLATMAGIAGGADTAYTMEEKFTVSDIKKNVQHLIQKFKYSMLKRGLILRTEFCNANYSTDFITRVYSEEGKGIFITRSNILGHIQQGGTPSPFDRLMGVRHGVRAFEYFVEQMEKCKDEFGCLKAVNPESACVLGHIKNMSQFEPVQNLIDKTDFKLRVPKQHWWKSISPLLRILAHYEVLYQRDVTDDDTF